MRVAVCGRNGVKMKILRGNAVVGQSGGPTAAINAPLSGVIRGALRAKKNEVINILYGMRNGIEGFLREDLINLTEIFAGGEGLDVLEQTPAAALRLANLFLRIGNQG